MSSIKEFEQYLDRVTDSMMINEEEKQDVKQEWRIHLHSLFDEYVKKGHSENEAIMLSLEQFGEPSLIESEVKKGFMNHKKSFFLKEMFIWMICLVAVTVGPMLLINAEYSPWFMLGTIVILAICYCIYHFILSKVSSPIFFMLGAAISYSFFVYLVITQSSFEFVLSQFTSFTLSGEGLFTIPMLHIFWVLIIILSWFSNTGSRSIRFVITKSTFRFWTMIAISFAIVVFEILTNSGEGKVILLNVFLLYGFLQEVIHGNFVVRTKNKIGYLIKRHFLLIFH